MVHPAVAQHGQRHQLSLLLRVRCVPPPGRSLVQLGEELELLAGAEGEFGVLLRRVVAVGAHRLSVLPCSREPWVYIPKEGSGSSSLSLYRLSTWVSHSSSLLMMRDVVPQGDTRVPN